MLPSCEPCGENSTGLGGTDGTSAQRGRAIQEERLRGPTGFSMGTLIYQQDLAQQVHYPGHVELWKDTESAPADVFSALFGKIEAAQNFV